MNGQSIILISNLKNSGPGHDGIPMFVLKENAEVLAPVITHMFNKSLSVGKYPSNSSTARFSCLYKVGDREKIQETIDL